MRTNIKFLMSTITTLLLMSACASIHPGNVAKQVPGAETLPPLVLSAEKDSELSDEYYVFANITIENKSSDIVRVQEGSISFDIAETQLPNVLVGQDLVAWLESAEAKSKLNATNRSFLNNALVFGGLGAALAGGLGQNSTVATIGSATMVAGATKTAIDETGQTLNQTQSARRVPETHLASSFSIPAGGFVRKWILFQNPKAGPPRGIIVKLVLEDQKAGKYAVALQ